MSAATGGHRASTAVNRASTAAARAERASRAREGAAVGEGARRGGGSPQRGAVEAAAATRRAARPARRHDDGGGRRTVQPGRRRVRCPALAELQRADRCAATLAARGSAAGSSRSTLARRRRRPPPDPARAASAARRRRRPSAPRRRAGRPEGDADAPHPLRAAAARPRADRWPLAQHAQPMYAPTSASRAAAAAVRRRPSTGTRGFRHVPTHGRRRRRHRARSPRGVGDGATPRGGPSRRGRWRWRRRRRRRRARRRSRWRWRAPPGAAAARRVEARSVRRSTVEARRRPRDSAVEGAPCPLPRPRARRRSRSHARARPISHHHDGAGARIAPGEVRPARHAHPLNRVSPSPDRSPPSPRRPRGGAGRQAPPRARRSERLDLQARPRRGGAGAAVARGFAAGGVVVGPSGGGAQPFEQRLVGWDAEQADPENVGEGPDGSVPGPARFGRGGGRARRAGGGAREACARDSSDGGSSPSNHTPPHDPRLWSTALTLSSRASTVAGRSPQLGVEARPARRGFSFTASKSRRREAARVVGVQPRASRALHARERGGEVSRGARRARAAARGGSAFRRRRRRRAAGAPASRSSAT